MFGSKKKRKRSEEERADWKIASVQNNFSRIKLNLVWEFIWRIMSSQTNDISLLHWIGMNSNCRHPYLGSCLCNCVVNLYFFIWIGCWTYFNINMYLKTKLYIYNFLHRLQIIISSDGSNFFKINWFFIYLKNRKNK